MNLPPIDVLFGAMIHTRTKHFLLQWKKQLACILTTLFFVSVVLSPGRNGFDTLSAPRPVSLYQVHQSRLDQDLRETWDFLESALDFSRDDLVHATRQRYLAMIGHFEKMAGNSSSAPPSTQYETHRRLLARDIRETRDFLGSNMGQTLETRNRLLSLEASLENVVENDSHGGWRADEFRELGDMVQARLRKLQNPPDCSNARKLVCKAGLFCVHSQL